MATSTTMFEQEILAGAFTMTDRGLMAGPAYQLRTLYLNGHAAGAPTHALAKTNPREVEALTRCGLLASFDAILGP